MTLEYLPEETYLKEVLSFKTNSLPRLGLDDEVDLLELVLGLDLGLDLALNGDDGGDFDVEAERHTHGGRDLLAEFGDERAGVHVEVVAGFEHLDHVLDVDAL